jgi:WD40 repeat protein
MDEEQSGEFAAPERIDAYRIVRRIGAGGMGTVYEAEQDEPHRRVALKVLRADASPQILRRFELEAEALGALHHPGVAQIYALGRFRSPSGTLPYIALEYVDGVTLTEYVDRKQLDQRQRVELLVKICSAIQHAHQHGVIHRDLKPGNILVDDDGQPKVLDFGVSRVVREGQPDVTALTQTGHLLGTVAYMSPEQARGERAVDTRADVYSLGVIGFEMLSGRLPHEISHLPFFEALQIIQQEAAPRLETVDPSLRGDLSIIMAKALAPERERRYASVAALADDLSLFLTDQPITARAPTITYQLSRFVRRNKALVGSVAVAFVGLIVGLVLALLARAEEAHQRAVAEQKTVEAQEAAYAAMVQAAMVYGGSGDVQSALHRLRATPPDLRGWEWDYLAASLEDDFAFYPMEILGGPCPAVSHDGTHALFAVDKKTLRLFDLAAGTWTDHVFGDPLPRSMALLADKRTFLAGDAEGRVRMMDLHGERAPRTVLEAGDDMRHMELAPDGVHAVMASVRKEQTSAVHVLDVETFAVVTHRGFPWIANADLSPDASLWAGGMFGGSVIVTDMRTGERRYTLRGHEHWGYHVRFSPSGLRLASTGADSAIRIWSLQTGREERMLGPFQDHPSILAFRRDDQTLFSGHHGGRIRRWNLKTGVCEWMTAGSRSPPSTAATMRLGFQGDRVFGIAQNGVHVRPVGEPVPSVLSHPTGPYPYVYDVEFSPSGRHLASSGWDGTVRIWDVATRKPVVVLPCPVNAFWARYSPDGRRLLVCAQQGFTNHIISLWDLTTLARLGSAQIYTNAPCGVFVPRAGCVVVGVGASLWIADPATLEVREKRAMPAPVWSLAPSPEGHCVACGLGDGACVVLDASSLQPLHQLRGHTQGVEALAFSPDGGRLATGAGDATIRIWDVDSGEQLRRFDIPEGREFFTLRFSPDGQRLLSGSRYPAIRIWNPESGREVVQLRGHASYIKGLAFSPDGKILTSASGDNTVRVWDTRSLEERIRERDRLLAAEDAVRARVARLFEELQALGKVIEAIEADSSLGELEKHAARNVAYRYKGEG